MKIYVMVDSEKKEVFSLNDVNKRLQNGEFDGNEPAWIIGLKDWTNLSNIEGVKIPSPPAFLEESPPPFVPDNKIIQDTSIKENNINKTEPKEIGGWLDFYCSVLIVLSPLFTFVKMSNNWVKSEMAFDMYQSLELFAKIENLVIATIVIIGMIAGYKIYQGDPNGRNIAQKFLLFRLFCMISMSLISYVILLSIVPQYSSIYESKLIGKIFYEGVVFSIWWLYFLKSKRVRNTYPDNNNICDQPIQK